MYYGSKFRVANRILKFTPPHKAYLDPFGGGAGIFWKKERSEIEVYNDLNVRVVNFFKQLRDNPEKLLLAIHLTPFARKELEYARNPANWTDELEDARCFFSESWMSIIGGGTNDNTSGLRGSRSRATFAPTMAELYACAERFKNVIIECTDAFDVIRRYDSEDTWIYIDPPYNGEPGNYYMNGFDNHKGLAELLHTCEAYVTVSGLDDKLYNELYWDWVWEELPVFTTGRNATTEALIMNYTL